MQILLIEDNHNQREILAGFLTKNGFDVISAIDGEEGILLFKENLVDIVITDFRMPHKNGLEVLRAVRLINPLAAVIVITAFSDVNDAVSVIKEGAMDYILKPINLPELLTKIRSIRSQIEIQYAQFRRTDVGHRDRVAAGAGIHVQFLDARYVQ